MHSPAAARVRSACRIPLPSTPADEEAGLAFEAMQRAPPDDLDAEDKVFWAQPGYGLVTG